MNLEYEELETSSYEPTSDIVVDPDTLADHTYSELAPERTVQIPEDLKTEDPVLICHFCKNYGTKRGFQDQHLLVTYCEVKQHDSEQDCWIVTRGEVFNATSVMSEHPGGRRSLVRRGGGAQDCDEDFDFHSQTAQRIWKRLQVARLVDCDPKYHPAVGYCVIC